MLECIFDSFNSGMRRIPLNLWYNEKQNDETRSAGPAFRQI